jgi:hypothetical protein
MEEYMFKKAAMFLFFISFVTFWCAAQSTNYEPRLVGTWTDLRGKIWVFNSDATGTGYSNNDPFKFGSIDGKLIMRHNSAGRTDTFELGFSKDGKTLFLFSRGNGGGYVLQKNT